MNGYSSALVCGRCQAPLPEAFYNASEMQPCPQCRTAARVLVFPAHYRVPAVVEAGPVSMDGEAVCFYHERKPAAVACDSCGRFLCGLCDVDLGERHLCATCLASTRNTNALNAFKDRHPRYDHMAFSLATMGLLVSLPMVFLSTLVTAPAALYLVVRHWRSPLSVVPRSRWKLVFAFLFAGLQLTAWAVGLYLLLVKVFTAW